MTYTKRILSIGQIKELYDRSMRNVTTRISDNPSKYGPLTELINFKQSSIGWAEVKGDSIHSMESKPAKGWIIVYPKDHEYVEDQSSPLVKVSTRPPLGLHIKPFAVDKTWAALILIHELTHMQDMISGIEPLQPNQNEYLDGEIRAYTNEILAANLFSGGKYDLILTEIYNEIQKPTLEQFYNLLGTKGIEYFISMYRKLDTELTDTEPKNEDEASLRYGFYTISLALLTVHLDQCISDEEKYMHKRAAIYNIMSTRNTNNTIPET